MICNSQTSVRNQFHQTIASAPNIVLHPFHAREEQTQRGHVFDDSMKTQIPAGNMLYGKPLRKNLYTIQ